MAMASDSPEQTLLETSRRLLPSFSDPTSDHRLFGPTGELMLRSSTFAALSGLVVGYQNGSKMASLRFRAEHAHKMPRDNRELYFYHRRKNYYSMKHGLQRGLWMGGRLAFWTSTYFLAEASVDFLRGNRKDFVSSTTAGMGVAGLFSLANRFSFVEAARAAKMGLVVGLAYGLLQDGLAMARGRRFRYFDFVFHRSSMDV